MSDLSKVKVGDSVLFRYMGGKCQAAVVEKITPTGRIQVAGKKFNPRGYEIGGSTWHKSYIDPFDKEILDRQAEEERISSMRYALREAPWSRLPDELIEKMHALLPTS